MKPIGHQDLGEKTAAAMQEYLSLSPTLTTFYAKGYALWSADQRFVLDKIEGLNSGSGLLANKLDVDRIGIMGMSFGGPSSIQTCSVGQRCRAGIILDGANYPSVNLESITIPFLYTRSAESIISLSNFKNFLVFKHQTTAYVLDVKQAEHFDFTDLPVLAPVFSLVGQLGSVPPEKMVGLTNAYVLAFFNQHLKAGLTTPIDEMDHYKDEVTFYVNE